MLAIERSTDAEVVAWASGTTATLDNVATLIDQLRHAKRESVAKDIVRSTVLRVSSSSPVVKATASALALYHLHTLSSQTPAERDTKEVIASVRFGLRCAEANAAQAEKVYQFALYVLYGEVQRTKPLPGSALWLLATDPVCLSRAAKAAEASLMAAASAYLNAAWKSRGEDCKHLHSLLLGADVDATAALVARLLTQPCTSPGLFQEKFFRGSRCTPAASADPPHRGGALLIDLCRLRFARTPKKFFLKKKFFRRKRGTDR